MRGKRMIIASDGKTGASTVFSSVSPDFQFMPSKEEETVVTKQVESAEKKAMQSAGMLGVTPTELEKKQRVKESEIKLGLKPIYKEEEQEGNFLNTYNVFADGSRKLLTSKSKPVKEKEAKAVRKEEVQEGLDQVFYEYYEDGSKKEVKRQVGKFKEDEILSLPEEISSNSKSNNQATITPITPKSWSNVQSGTISINPGDVISDTSMGQLKFKGGDSSDLENYEFVGFPEK
jgi:Icc-related predicted phosphoesterase